MGLFVLHFTAQVLSRRSLGKISIQTIRWGEISTFVAYFDPGANPYLGSASAFHGKGPPPTIRDQIGKVTIEITH
jgi:hypothetical protein